VRTLFATHYHELTALEGRLPRVRNYNIAVKEWKGEIIFLRRLVPGPSDRSYGIEVARLAGVPRGVITRARQILDGLDGSARGPRGRRAQVRETLPGMFDQPLQNEVQPAQELLERLRTLDPENLNPEQALILLREWKMALASPDS